MKVSKTEAVVPVLVATAASLLIAKFRPFGKELVWLKGGVTVGGLTLSTFFITRAFRKKPSVLEQPKDPELPATPEKKDLPNPFEAQLVDNAVRTVAEALRDLEIDEDKLRALGDVVLALRATPKLKKSKRRSDLDRMVGPLFCLPDDLFGGDKAGQTYMGWIKELRETKPSKEDDPEFVELANKVVYGLSLALWKVYSEEEQQKIIDSEKAPKEERSSMLPDVASPPASAEVMKKLTKLTKFKNLLDAGGQMGFRMSPVKEALKDPEFRKKVDSLDSEELGGALRGFVEPMKDNASRVAKLQTPVRRRGSSSPSSRNPLEEIEYNQALRAFQLAFQRLKEAKQIVESVAKATRPFARESLKHTFEKIQEALSRGASSGNKVRKSRWGSLDAKAGVKNRLEALQKKSKPLLQVRVPGIAGLTPYTGGEKYALRDGVAALALLQTRLANFRDLQRITLDGGWETVKPSIPIYESSLEEVEALTVVVLTVIREFDRVEGKL